MSKNVLITGASQGIGKEIAKVLSNADYNIFLTSRNKSKLKEVSQEINACDYCVCDLACETALKKLKKFIEDKQIDILVNNAGEYIYEKIDDTDYQKLLKVYSVNLLASTFLCSAVAKGMKKRGWGRIINIGSISGVMGEAYASVYSASKAGLIGLSRSLALELAEFNITVNTINPGWVETELGMKSVEESEFSLSETLETIPQKRFVNPEEVGKLVEYLISDSAKGITGQSINLCAGLSVGI